MAITEHETMSNFERLPILIWDEIGLANDSAYSVEQEKLEES
jgi:hypothetical protein